jgi:predicted peptidase
MILRILVVLCALTILRPALAQPAASESMQTAQTLKRRVTQTVDLKYLLFLPKGYNRKSPDRWPLIFFLHGAGERGTNLAKVKVHGPPKIVASQPDFPFIVVSPQCPDSQVWDPAALLTLLDDVIRRHRVNTNRIYLTGLSMGGYGTWRLGLTHPERFAAMAPICGGGDVIDALLPGEKQEVAIKTLGVWVFHGAKDPVVPVVESERMVAALRKAGCSDIKLTVYPDADHDSWTESYANQALYDWFLQHERKPGTARKARK